jgi:hypothetical protein
VLFSALLMRSMLPQQELNENWAYFRTLLPENLDESAAQTGALVRKRGIRDAEALLRILLAYGCTDLSLQSLAAWGKQGGLSDCTKEALFFRVRDSASWLSELLTQMLASEVKPVDSGLRLRVVDATVLCGPGATGTDWRVHALSDPATGRLCSVEVTDAHVGESFALHPVQPGDVVLGDRGYSTARGLHANSKSGAFTIVRLNPHTIRLCDTQRSVIPILNRRDQVPQTGVITWNVLVPIPPDSKTKSHKSWSLSKAKAWLPARVVAARTRKGDVIWVLTTVPTNIATDVQIMDSYRLRWQIELQFKRFKSLLDLDMLPTRSGPTARSWILAKLLAAALIQELNAPNGAFPPWGYRLR